MAEKSESTSVSTEKQRKAAKDYEKKGLQAYQEWDIDEAIECFQKATHLVPDEPTYLLGLARVLARSGDFDRALRALADFIRLEPNSPSTNRFESLFASGMDEVEALLTDKMTQAGTCLEEIGAAIQMWLEYRITLGHNPLTVRKPETWAAALDYTVRKVNLRPVKRREIAAFYGVSERAVQERHDDLVHELDVMPCDYRYFTNQENPLDKLVEAAEILEQLEARFQEP
jgi:tetratricopeptide (TPR) repeat protein